MLDAIWTVMLALAPWVLLGAAVAGVLHVVLPEGFVHRHLGRGRSGVVKAVALGIPLPLCSCGVIPAGLGLRRDGASPGASVGFVISTPQTGVDSTLVAASFLGWPFALLKVGVAAVTGIVGGWLTDAVIVEREVAEPARSSSAATVDRSVRGALDHAMEVLRSIWRWLVFGVVVSALIDVFVPPRVFDVFTGAGQGWALLAVLGLSLPLYVCATASVPIAAALVAGGFSPGAALVFLMAGPATNVATLGAVYRALGRRALAVYLGTIVVGSMAAALLFESVLARGGGMAHAHGEHGSLVASALTVGLLGLLAWFAIGELRDTWRARRRVEPKAGSTVGAHVVELSVEGMTCGGCANKLRRALLAEDGVLETEVDHEAGRAVVRSRVPEPRLRDIVAQVGFRTV
ncbi:MAG: permease [Myxococcota bacterium]